ncbi:Lipopolysaccharide biosynthesis protein, LPS:glycosyltransferase [Lishizhenia tianjinensis]|uniref:Lipopolysaccharide biosynthesis protein, LPS:glycosyltransferase n=1 Tax=Lishizhenia tianjinensis TaxID=477690 RepID=A0A1I6ZUV8_9FLAO|nr:glycosyltransferase family 8 protein [Lishizhenia tianjinensis]SFT66479.1 Lipopolysaccharide biosynthesis protein, LPS:glycosyltransferase [Lishizhenia tianjinensis]
MVIPIVLSSNNGYVPYMSTAIESIMENAGCNHQYRIHIFHKEISDEFQELLFDQVKNRSNFSIEFIDVRSHFLKFAPYTAGISIEAYYRLYIPYYFNNDEKVLYLDCDLICNRDVADLFNFDIGDHLIGAVRGLAEIGWYNSTENHYWDTLLKLENPKNYFNSGVMLINTSRFRNEISFDQLLSETEKEEYPCYDQDVLNIVCQEKCYFIPNEWNFIKYPLAENLDAEMSNIYSEVEKKPGIIHFATGYKPWSNQFYVPFAYDFWKYAMRTPFADIIKERMNDQFTVFNKEKLQNDFSKVPYFVLVKSLLLKLKNKIFN